MSSSDAPARTALEALAQLDRALERRSLADVQRLPGESKTEFGLRVRMIRRKIAVHRRKLERRRELAREVA